MVDEIATIVERNIIIEAGDILKDEEVGTIPINSRLLTGSIDAIEQFSSGGKILYKETYCKNTLCAIYGKIEDVDIIKARKYDVSVESLPLKKFFTNLIEGGSHVE